jgi:shikimate kinase/3-dehydroquinate synthase
MKESTGASLSLLSPHAEPARAPSLEESIRRRLGARSIALVGLMGAGKTSVGRRLALRLGLPFRDADHEIEAAAGMPITDIFATFGEPHFRNGERRVIARLLQNGPQVLGTGGGAFMSPETRARIAEAGVSVWLKADLDTLMRRVRKRANRPLLKTPDPEATMRQLMAARDPIYALADLTVESREAPHERVVQDIVRALDAWLTEEEIHVAAPPQTGAYEPGPLTAPTPAHTPTVGASRPAPEPGPVTVHVPLGERAYDILIGRGLLDESGARIAALGARAAAIVADETVAGLYAERLAANLGRRGLRTATIPVPPGEGSKSYAMLAQVCDAILEARIERDDLVVALGGGVIGDLAGFAAAVVRRGVRFVQVPTTLLAQVDSSVGGKTGINSSFGKNLVGAFHQPSLVLADTALLDTLPLREIRAGYAEVVKYGLIGDEAFFAWCEARWRGVFSGGPERDHAVAHNCRAKAAVVVRDEREEGDRALLNLGHTFGHALERVTGYDSARLIHGEAVAIGLALAFRFSARLGLCPGPDADRVARHLTSVGLPTRLQDVPGGCGSAEALVAAMAQDKKVKAGALTFILAHGIGRGFIARGVEAEAVCAFLAQELGG